MAVRVNSSSQHIADSPESGALQGERRIGIIYMEESGRGLTHPFFSLILDAFKKEAESRGCEITFLNTGIPGSGMICTLDIGDKSNIHPTRKIEVGRRLANLALAKTYGREIDALSPRFASMEVSGNRIMVSVQDEPLAPPTDSYTGFEICGADKKFYPANALLSGGRIAVSSPSVSAPVAVRYCFYNYKVGNVKGQNGLPLMPFRTDK